ncbi:MAG TPA: efflux RND transporter periplasmic adaptor subunit, partial [Flavisolibacter sp.]|nr:efflux RND transporter periplasmic adaptor subunit [Flavisolibacter sp.]
MSKTLKWILLSIATLVLLLVVVRAVNGSKKAAINVTVEAAKQRTITETVSASGKVYPETEIRIAPPIAGEITELNVQEGDKVQKGQVLARIQGERTAGATQRVSLPAGVPPGFEGLVQGLQPQRATSASSATVKAPVSGTVLGLAIKKGERVNGMGNDMMRIADFSQLEVRVDVNENNIIKVAIGDSADVEVEAYNKRKFKGIVTTITNGSTKRDAQSFLSADVTAYEVHIRLLPSSYADLYDTVRKNIPFRPGMNARADIKTARRNNVLSIPVGAVVSRSKGKEESIDEMKKEKVRDENVVEEPEMTDELEEVVFVLKNDGTVEKRVVETGIQDMTYFEISKGLQAGEKVVTAPYTTVSKTLRS